MRYASIIGYGYYTPDKVLANADFEKTLDTTNEWIIKMTGIQERRIADSKVFSSDVACEAAKKALLHSGLSALDIDLIIVATTTPDMYAPSTACLVQKGILAMNAAAFDVNAACSGFIYALTIAKQFICSGTYRNILIIGAECLSKVVEYQDRSTCVLFGDGAGAMILSESGEKKGVLATYLGSDGSASDVLTIPGLRQESEDIARRPFGNNVTIWMNGGEVFKFAVKAMSSAVNQILVKSNLSMDDISLIIPHQANIRIIQSAMKRLSCSDEKIFTNVNRYGNMSSASVPVAFCESISEGRLKAGDNCIVVGFGAGMTWGGALLKI